MGKKQKKILQDTSIPIRVTQAKNASRHESGPSASTDDVKEIQKKRGQEGRVIKTDLEKLLSPDGKARDMSTFEQGNPRRRLIIRILLILAGLFAVTVGGFFYFTRDSSEFGQNITFAIVAPNVASSGDVVTISVRYENKESIDLLDSEITMQFPENFSFQSSIPSPTSTNTWNLDTLKANAGGVLEIKGRIVGDIGEESIFSGKLVYTPSNFHYAFEEEATHAMTISSSTLSLDIDSPLRTPPDKEFTSTITYTNSSEVSLENIQIVLEAPSGFTLSSSEPLGEKNKWTIENLDSQEEGKITFKGVLSGQPGDQPQFTVRIGFVDAQGVFTPQAEKSVLVLLIKAGLTLAVETDVESGFVEWGDSVEYTVRYTNDGDVPLENIKLQLELTGETSGGTESALIDWDGITTLDGGVIQDTVVSWDSGSVEALKEIKPQDTGSFSVTIPFVENPEVTSDGDEEFHVLAEFTASPADQENAEAISRSDIHEVKIATQILLEAEARYYSDTLTEIGSGPLPPQAGEGTEYVIFWNITNTTNDVEDVVVVSTLPTGVKWVGESTISAGDPLSYNPQTKTVTWKINRIPAGAGNLFPELEAQFTVELVPTADQVGTFALLCNIAELTAQDSFVAEARASETGVLTTNLLNDPGAKGAGTVAEAPNTNS